MSQSNDITDIKVAIGVLKEQNNAILKRQESMEKKIDGMSYVKQADFDKAMDSIKATYSTKDELSPIKKVFYGILLAGSAGVVGLFFWFVQWAIERLAS